MTDTTNTKHDTTEAEARLATGRDPDPATWQRIRDDLTHRAVDADLVDVAFERHESPLGTILLGATTEGLVRVGLPSEEEAAVLDELASRVSRRIMRAPHKTITAVRAQLDGYFEGGRYTFHLPLDWRLTAGFRREVLRATARIPYGRTASYREVATQAGSPGAVRAAGTALALNPLPIVVPCHRVLRSGGGLGGYRGGTAMKERLLELEGAA